MLKAVLKVGGMLLVRGLVGMASYGYMIARGDLEELALPSTPIQQEQQNQTLVPTIPSGQSEDGVACCHRWAGVALRGLARARWLYYAQWQFARHNDFTLP